jgi:two-component system, OmpR family, phosphate regulon sensor histidine kinase PhoR
LQDLDAAKTALISTVNHELRTPLTSIIGYVELMQRDEKLLENAGDKAIS